MWNPTTKQPWHLNSLAELKKTQQQSYSTLTTLDHIITLNHKDFTKSHSINKKSYTRIYYLTILLQ